MEQAGTVTEYEGRPDQFVYHEHCFHVLDIKVLQFYEEQIMTNLFQPCQCNEIGFGLVDQILGRRDHSQYCHGDTQLFFNTADLVGKVSFTQQNVKLHLAHFE